MIVRSISIEYDVIVKRMEMCAVDEKIHSEFQIFWNGYIVNLLYIIY